MNFSEFLRLFLAENHMRPCDLREHLNKCGVRTVKGTVERWIRGERTPNPFKQRRIGNILNADCILLDDKIVYLPRRPNNIVANVSSNNLDNSGGAV